MVKQIKSLTSLRFFFALMVFLSHLEFLKDSTNKTVRFLYNDYFSEGYIGVSFFFILSGFILSYNYFDKLIEKKDTVRSYYINRFSRIYPLHFITFLLSLPLLFNKILLQPFLYLLLSLINVCLLQSFFPIREVFFNFNFPAWSISDEMFFYLATPFLFLFIGKIKLLSQKLVLILLFFGLIFAGISLTPVFYHQAIFYVNPLVRVLDFTVGIVLFSLFRQIKLPNLSKGLFTFFEFLAVTLFCLFFYFHQSVIQGFRFSIYYWLPIILIIMIFSFDKGYLSDLLSNRYLIYLGEISFGFYMIHQLVIRYDHFFLKKMGLGQESILNIVSVFILTILVSAISFEYYEKKMNRLLKKTLK